MGMVKKTVFAIVLRSVRNLDPLRCLKAVVLFVSLMCPPVGHAATPQLQCRQGQQSWVQCQMNQHLPGEHWFLNIGDMQIEFRHDGSGRMRMREGGREHWISVEPRWSEDQSLCWGDVCARGEIRLD